MTTFVSPGVYVQEVPSGVRAIAGVSTSVALFIGYSNRGPINVPTRCGSYRDFERVFGTARGIGDLATYVRMFFLNGGSDCWIIRIAKGATQSSVELLGESAVPDVTRNYLRLTAKQAGAAGEYLRARVSYRGDQADRLFNLEVLKFEGGRAVEIEEFRNLSMDPDSATFVDSVLGSQSSLVSSAATPGGGVSTSTSTRPVDAATGVGAAFASWVTPTQNAFSIQVGNTSPVTVALDPAGIAAAGTSAANVAGYIQTTTQAAIDAAGFAGIAVTAAFVAGPNRTPASVTRLLQFSSTDGDVRITPAANNDISVALRLGPSGGIETSRFSEYRPAQTGTWTDGSLETFIALGSLQDTEFDALEVEVKDGAGTRMVPIPVAGLGSGFVWKETGVDILLNQIARAINDEAHANPSTFPVRATVAGYRLHLESTKSDDQFSFDAQFVLAGAPVATAPTFSSGTRYVSVGRSGVSTGYQISPGTAATDGSLPEAAEYRKAYEIVDREIDTFNLLVLPPRSSNDGALSSFYAEASNYCERRKAFLIMDPPMAWDGPQAASTGINDLRIGVSKQYAAVYYPNVVIPDGANVRTVGPAGAVAGLYARTDTQRGVWKAPAGTEASLFGVVASQRPMSDTENGWIYPRAINAVRVFPNGIVSWGSRTMDGDDENGSEYKDIAVRRLANYIELSLQRGLKWTVFEPNGPVLWQQIRLNVNAFMQQLYRQGAFAGRTAKQSFSVVCDETTTTPTDQKLGIVNVDVGFLPLNAAEFVVIRLQQMVRQTQGEG